jgi:Putative adhesin
VLLALLTGSLALAATQQVDTTLNVARGQRLDVNAYAGDVTVRAWNRNAVRVEASTSNQDQIEITSSSTAVSVRTQGRHGPPEEIQLRISVPSWMSLRLSGVNTGAKVEGIRAPVSVETVEGEVDVTGGEGLVSLRSVQGSVRLRGARGRINLNSVNEDIDVTGSSGDVVAQTVNGEIDLQVVDASSIDANTVNGDISYSGPIKSGGRYALSTHNGDLSLTVAEGTSASVAVSTFSGDFESEFPVPLRGTQKGKGFNFTLGSGSAQVSLESFQGTIRLVRPGSEQDPARRRDHERAGHEHDRDED